MRHDLPVTGLILVRSCRAEYRFALSIINNSPLNCLQPAGPRVPIYIILAPGGPASPASPHRDPACRWDAAATHIIGRLSCALSSCHSMLVFNCSEHQNLHHNRQQLRSAGIVTQLTRRVMQTAQFSVQALPTQVVNFPCPYKHSVCYSNFQNLCGRAAGN